MQIELAELVDRMIGTYTSHGDSGIDHEAMENLEEIKKLLRHVLHKLVDNAEQKNSYEGSVADIGKQSYDILMECKEYCQEAEDYKNHIDYEEMLDNVFDRR
jgi:hypothetical protein